MSLMSVLLKASGNKDAQIMVDDVLSTPKSYLDTGCYALNALISSDIYKGIPSNRIIGLAGEQATGKTYLALGICKNAIEAGYSVLYFDSENAVDSDMIKERGIDPSKIVHYPVDTCEDFRDQVFKILTAVEEENDSSKKQEKILLVLDSLGNLSTKKELKDVEEGNDKADMTRARVIKSLFRVLQKKLAKTNVPLIITNHVYDDVAAANPKYAGKKISGGSGLRYAASIIITLSKSKAKDSQNNLIGNYIKCKSFKNRFAKEGAVVEVLLDYTDGLNRYYGLQDFASPIIQKSARGYKIGDKNVTIKKLMSSNWEELDENLMDTIRDNCKKNFSYGSDSVSQIEDVDSDE